MVFYYDFVIKIRFCCKQYVFVYNETKEDCMLELRNVTKKYRSKKGNTTVALNNISLKFGERGMVFILGKSGSGKSTLLNVLGGLDKYDSGEIIIQGKSSKKFKAQDFDSYRNTYIGFVFQEFNILEDYTVYRNVALALQLQKKDVNRSKVESVLEKLDLKGFENRKPNELSGGQKQRVAIARALVKDPDIIMADEPTGALDSVTGTQVFDVLKDVSKEKLVIVVSHDREAAEKYADRIVEFQDGNIINDTAPDIAETKTNIFQLIKSKLPWKESFKLGFGSLNHKKIRLAFTILLAACALGFLGMSDTMSSFNMARAHAKLVSEEKAEVLKLQKYLRIDDWNSFNIYFNDSNFNPTKLKNSTPYYRLLYQQNELNLTALGISSNNNSSLYFRENYDPLEFIELQKKEDFLEEEILGHYPTSKDEIAISNYLADFILNYGITLTTNDSYGLPELWKPKTYDEIINSNRFIELGNFGKVKISGIIKYDLSEYSKIKNLTNAEATRKDYNLSSKLSSMYSMLYNKIFVADGFLKQHAIKENNVSINNHFYYKLDNQHETYEDSVQYPVTEISYFDGKEWKKTTTLEKNQILISIDTLDRMSSGNSYSGTSYNEKLQEYLTKNPDGDETSYFENFVRTYNYIGDKLKVQVSSNYYYNDNKMESYELEIIGVTKDNDFMSKDFLKDYVEPTVSLYGYLTKETDRSTLETYFNEYPYDGEYSLKSIYSSEVEGLSSAMKVIKKFAFYASLVFFVFAIFLIMNFIFTSIAYRKKEIGILRAIGARNVDVLKIFLWEGFLIAIISGVLAITGTTIVSALLNRYIQTQTGMLVTPLIVTIRQYGLLLGTVFIIVLIASILPIAKISRMKPMDAILNK